MKLNVKKGLTIAIAAALVVAGAGTASARHHHHHHYGARAFGGAFAGALVGSLFAPPPVVVAPQPSPVVVQRW